MIWLGLALLVISLPYWLPPAIIRLRGWVFTRINGEEGIAVPGPLVPVSQFRALYAHPAASGRSRGAVLSDLFWYWLSPGADLHQEHLEAGQRYEDVAEATRRFLAMRKDKASDLATRSMRQVLDEGREDLHAIRLRDLMMPVWAGFYHELVFGKPCSPEVRDLIVGNADDVVTALKGSSLRHMRRREALTAWLEQRLREGALIGRLPVTLSLKEQALYLQGVFFNTAVVQMSEAMTHLMLALAQHRAVQARVLSALEDDRLLDRVIAETLRQFPLFGIAHRITQAPIEVAGQTLPAGSVLCFNYADYQRSGFSDPDRFDPDRWEGIAGHNQTYIPFGVTENRPCPAHAIALVTMRAAARALLERFSCESSVSHTRSIPHRGPCILVPRAQPVPARRLALMLAWLRIRDRWEDVGRSIRQLVLGTIMVLHARREGLAKRHFEGAQRCPFHTGQPTGEAQCAPSP
ncbi:cytochrome P450 [Novosphingobium terrae]|uniref:cytochrome P450 n=1 Tax=Novosphingobium terrae TaxID=2726189 RepID=UPI00198257B3|nr:cytochrome P450 [Novosphingobium terrae]